MSGHSKWSTIKRKKGAIDAVRGKLFTKLGKEIIVDARMGGGDPDANPRLRTAVDAAKAQSMPKDNIERAIKRGTGELKGDNIEELVYEGYGPAGVAVMVETATDNKNRTVADLRKLFKSSGGSLAENGAVGYLFTRLGQLTFDASKHTEEQVMEIAMEAGAQDISESDGIVTVLTDPTEIYKVKEAFDKVGMHSETAGFSFVPSTMIPIDGENAEKVLKLMDGLDDHDDVQHVHANFDIDEKVLAELAEES